MSMRLLIVCLLLITLSLVSIAQTKPHSVRIHKHSSTFINSTKVHRKHDFLNKYINSKTGQPAGNTIDLGGGLLTIGTYYAQVTIGTPPQSFDLLFDTGSSNLAVITSNTSSHDSGYFNPTASSTYQPMLYGSQACSICSPPGLFSSQTTCVFQQPFPVPDSDDCAMAVTYGGGASGLFGPLATESVCFGAPNTNCVKQQPIGLIQSQYPDGQFVSRSLQGIVGVAFEFNACNPTCVAPIGDTIAQQFNQPNLLGVCLTPSNGGTVDVGYVNSTRYSGELLYTPITLQHWYNIELLDILIGNYSIGVDPFMYYTTNDVIGTFVDSGTSILLTSPYAFSQIQATFQTHFCNVNGVCGNNTIFDGCMELSSINNFPNVQFTFAGMPGQSNFTLPVPPQSYLMQHGKAYCLAIESVFGVGNVLGDVFMENYYVVFDKQNLRLGFAKQTNCF